MATLGFTCFGSAGDLFPVLTVAEAVEQRGHHVTVIVPRSLGALAARSPLPVRVRHR